MEKLCACCEALQPQECTWRARAPTAACQPSLLSPVSSHWPAWLTSPVAAPPAKSVHAAGSTPSPVCTAMHLGQDLPARSQEPGALQLIVCLESALAHNLFLFFPLHTMVYFFLTCLLLTISLSMSNFLIISPMGFFITIPSSVQSLSHV